MKISCWLNLIGFDVRYIGTDPIRTRFYKIKAQNVDLFFSTFGLNLTQHDPATPIIVTEGYVDALSIFYATSTPTLATLTVQRNDRLIAFLGAITKNILLMYDQDDAGVSAARELLNHATKTPPGFITFNTIKYLGTQKDPNEILMQCGPQYLAQVIEATMSTVRNITERAAPPAFLPR